MDLSDYYKECIKNLLEKALVYDSKLTDVIYNLEGFSGKMTQCFNM